MWQTRQGPGATRAEEQEHDISDAAKATPTVRSDHELILQSRRLRAACKNYRLSQEFITPPTPEQNGIIERFFRSLKEKCVWQHTFEDFTHARNEVIPWIHRYNTRRPHWALGSAAQPSSSPSRDTAKRFGSAAAPRAGSAPAS